MWFKERFKEIWRKRKKANGSEMNWLHEQVVFEPISMNELMPKDKKEP